MIGATSSGLQPHLAMTPSAKIALAFEATGSDQGLNAGGEHFAGDSESKLFASFHRLPDDEGHLAPLWGYDGENDPIDPGFGGGRRKLNLLPPERAADFGKLLKRDRVRESIKNRLQQLGIELYRERR